MRPRTLPLLLITSLVALSCASRSGNGTPWRSLAPAGDSAWIPFTWQGDSLGGRYYEHAAIGVPVRIDGVPRELACQLDLGSNVSLLYENPLAPYIERVPSLGDRLGREKAWFILWNNDRAFHDLPLRLGPVPMRAASIRLMKDYGATADDEDTTAPLWIGTLGVDLVAGRTIVIDYPGRRFRILDSIPPGLAIDPVDIGISRNGFAILPLRVGESIVQTLFDTGSSLFKLLTLASEATKISGAPPVDTIRISSWGKLHDVVGRPVRGRVGIAGHDFEGVEVYGDAREDQESFYRTEGIGAITGNALFQDQVIVIDYAHRKFGIVKGGMGK